MPTTEHIHLPLYTDEETPDLSTTGHYNHAMEILDANVGELEKKDAELAENIADEREARIAGDSALDAKLAAETKARTDADTALDGKVAAETAAREAADTALGSRIDNAETEISANSADLTGIKGLTYGTGKQVFLENDDGEYSSPALEEIQHEISGLQASGWYVAEYDGYTNTEVYEKLIEHWPKCALVTDVVVHTRHNVCVLMPSRKDDPSERDHITRLYTLIEDDFYNDRIILAYVEYYPKKDAPLSSARGTTNIALTGYVTWENASKKPFSTIGTGLKVVSDALTVDTSALPSGIDANTTFGDLTAGVTS